jgi:hypothetical protein
MEFRHSEHLLAWIMERAILDEIESTVYGEVNVSENEKCDWLI